MLHPFTQPVGWFNSRSAFPQVAAVCLLVCVWSESTQPLRAVLGNSGEEEVSFSQKGPLAQPGLGSARQPFRIVVG